MYMNGSLCCTAKFDRTSLINYNKKKPLKDNRKDKLAHSNNGMF